jgi:hypothetical protein
MARTPHSAAKEFAAYAVETLRRELNDPETREHVMPRYRMSASSSSADALIKAIFESLRVEIADDGEIYFTMKRKKNR